MRGRGLVLVVLAAITAASAAQSPLITTCQAVTEFVAGSNAQPFPRAGTTFCPTEVAFQKFAKDSGYKSFEALFSAARARPAAWKPYLRRLMTYAYVPTVTPASVFPQGMSSLTTALADVGTGSGAAGNTTLKVQRRANGNVFIRHTRSGLYSMNGMAKVTDFDVLKTSNAVVHGVDQVLMAPDTYHTISRACKRLKVVKHTRRWMANFMKDEIQSADTWGTFLLPTDDAWKKIMFKRKARLPDWIGNVTMHDVAKEKPLQEAVLRYATIALPASDAREVLTYDSLYKIWQLSAGQNFVSLPTALTAGTKQLTYYTYDASTDRLYAVGHRNMHADLVVGDGDTYMAGGQIQQKTIYAGSSTILLVDGYVPLPEKTGVAKFDRLRKGR